MAAATNAVPPMTSHINWRLTKKYMSPRLSWAKAPVLKSMTIPMARRLPMERIRM